LGLHRTDDNTLFKSRCVAWKRDLTQGISLGGAENIQHSIASQFVSMPGVFPCARHVTQPEERLRHCERRLGRAVRGAPLKRGASHLKSTVVVAHLQEGSAETVSDPVRNVFARQVLLGLVEGFLPSMPSTR
jgi:hypothetical protein